MVALAASLFDLTGVRSDPAAVREMLFLAIAAVVVALVVYGLRREGRL